MTAEEHAARTAAAHIEAAGRDRGVSVMATAVEHEEDGWFVTVDMDTAIAGAFTDWLRSGQ